MAAMAGSPAQHHPPGPGHAPAEPHKEGGASPAPPAGWGFSLFGAAPAAAPAPHDHAHEHAHSSAGGPPAGGDHPPAPEGESVLAMIGKPFVIAGEGIASGAVVTGDYAAHGANETGKGAYVAGDYVVGGTVAGANAVGAFFTATIPGLFVAAPAPEGHAHGEGHPPAGGPPAPAAGGPPGPGPEPHHGPGGAGPKGK